MIILLVQAAVLNSGPSTFWCVIHFFKGSQEMRDKVLKEIEHAVELSKQESSENSSNNPLLFTEAALNSMVILDSFIMETLRLYSSVAPLRQTTKRMELVTEAQGKTISIPEKTDIVIPGYVIHSDPDLYDKPEEFRYDRFVNFAQQPQKFKNGKPVPRSTHFVGFGAGKHICPGRFFAKNEIKAVIATILNMFTFDIHGNVPPMNEAEFAATLKPLYDIDCTISCK